MTDAAAATPLPTAEELHRQKRISRHLAARATRARRLHERAALSTSTRANVGPGASRSRQVRPPAPRPPCRRHSLVRHVSDARLRALFAGYDTKLGENGISRRATASIPVRAPAALGSLSAAIQPCACDADSPHTSHSHLRRALILARRLIGPCDARKNSSKVLWAVAHRVCVSLAFFPLCRWQPGRS